MHKVDCSRGSCPPQMTAEQVVPVLEMLSRLLLGPAYCNRGNIMISKFYIIKNISYTANGFREEFCGNCEAPSSMNDLGAG